MLNRRDAKDELRRFLGALKLRRDHPHVVPATTEFFLVGADAAGHAPHVRKIRVGEHDDSQRGDPSAGECKWRSEAPSARVEGVESLRMSGNGSVASASSIL